MTTATTCSAIYHDDDERGISGLLLDSLITCACETCVELLDTPVFVQYSGEYASDISQEVTTIIDTALDYHFSYTMGAHAYIAEDNEPWDDPNPYPDYVIIPAEVFDTPDHIITHA